MEVFIIRHTQVTVSKALCYGQSDVALAESFEEEAAQIKANIPTDFELVYSSPLQRCMRLATYLSESVRIDEALKEVDFGAWEMKPWEALPQEELNQWMQDFVHVAPPQGESLKTLYERVAQFMDKLRTQPHQKIGIITHAGVIRCIYAYLLEIPLHNIFKIDLSYGAILHCKLSENKDWDKLMMDLG